MNDDLRKLYTNVGYQIDSILVSSGSKVSGMRVNGQYIYGSKGSKNVVDNPERDYLRFDELEIAFAGSYKSTRPVSVVIDCCPDTNILPFLRNFPYELVKERINEELLKQSNKVDAERVACIESCLNKLIKRFAQ